MKKLASLIMAVGMVFTMGTMAYAAPAGQDASCKEVNITKKYVTADGKTPATFPKETLSFQVKADPKNPDGSMIGVNDVTIKENPDDVFITLPEYTKVGEYIYTVTENTGNTLGVDYSKASFDVKVQVFWDDAHEKLETNTVFYSAGEPKEKIEVFENIYNLGSLSVSKTVTGNLGDQEKEFLVDVTFTVEDQKEVKSDITYQEGEVTKTISAEALADGTETVTIPLKHDATVTFVNIPQGMSYTVKEQDYTTGDLNGENKYDNPAYALNGEELGESATEVTGKIAHQEEKVNITNNKGTIVDTGVILESIPYVLVLGLVAAGTVILIMKKRRITD